MSYQPRVRAHFDRALLRAKTTLALYDFVKKESPAALDSSDLLRASVVFAVSAFDYFIHQLIRFEIEDRVLRKRSMNGVSVPIEFTLLDEANLIKSTGLHIKSANGYKSFVSVPKLAEGLKNILDEPWSYISEAFGSEGKDIKARLTLIVDLRNRIAHEGDLDPEMIVPESYQIERDDIFDSIQFIEKLGIAIAEAIEVRSGEFPQ
jgi:hypothetical protein